MRIFLNDVKYAWRGLFKRPLLTATVAVTLALGLGANAAIFNLIDRLVLRPFPALDPDNVVMIAETGPRLDYRRETTSPRQFHRLAGRRRHRHAPVGDPLVGREPRGARGPGAAAGHAGLVRILRRARHPPGARPRIRPRRRDLRPSSRRHPERRAVEAALRRRPGDRRPAHHDRRRAARGRRRGAAALRLSGRRGALGADRLRSRPAASPRRALSHGDWAHPGGQDAGRRPGADGRARRPPGARVSRGQPRSRGPRLHADAGDDG